MATENVSVRKRQTNESQEPENKVYGERGFRHELCVTEGQSAVLIHFEESGLVLPSNLYDLHEGIADRLQFDSFRDYLEFCLKETLNYWFKVDPARFGKLASEGMLIGNGTPDLCRITGD